MEQMMCASTSADIGIEHHITRRVSFRDSEVK